MPLRVDASEAWQVTSHSGPGEIGVAFICPTCSRTQVINMQSPPWRDSNGDKAATVTTTLWCHLCAKGTDAILTED